MVHGSPDPTIEQSGFCSIVDGSHWMGKEAQGK